MRYLEGVEIVITRKIVNLDEEIVQVNKEEDKLIEKIVKKAKKRR